MYKVFDVEEKTSSKGNKYKKLVLQKEGAQFPTKNVTMFANHPEYDKTVAGYTLNCELKETDSGTPNPNAPGKNYIDRVVANPGEAGVSAKPSQIDSINTGKIDRIFYMVDQIYKHVVPKEEGSRPDYPEIDESGIPF